MLSADSRSEYQRRARFLLIAVVAYGVYLIFYAGLRTILPHAVTAPLFILAILAGDSVNYLGNRYWVFRHTREGMPRQGGRFFLVSFFTLAIQSLLFWLGERFTPIPVPVLVLGLPGIRIILNYFLHRVITFPEPSSPSSGRTIY